MISRYCSECKNHKSNNGSCVGKNGGIQTKLVKDGPEGYSHIKTGRFHGLNFCRQFSFDARQYTFPNGEAYSGFETFQKAKKRGNKKRKTEVAQETASHVDAANDLSSDDFDDFGDLLDDINIDNSAVEINDIEIDDETNSDDQLSSLDVNEFLI